MEPAHTNDVAHAPILPDELHKEIIGKGWQSFRSAQVLAQLNRKWRNAIGVPTALKKELREFKKDENLIEDDWNTDTFSLKNTETTHRDDSAQMGDRTLKLKNGNIVNIWKTFFSVLPQNDPVLISQLNPHFVDHEGQIQAEEIPHKLELFVYQEKDWDKSDPIKTINFNLESKLPPYFTDLNILNTHFNGHFAVYKSTINPYKAMAFHINKDKILKVLNLPYIFEENPHTLRQYNTALEVTPNNTYIGASIYLFDLHVFGYDNHANVYNIATLPLAQKLWKYDGEWHASENTQKIEENSISIIPFRKKTSVNLTRVQNNQLTVLVTYRLPKKDFNIIRSFTFTHTL